MTALDDHGDKYLQVILLREMLTIILVLTHLVILLQCLLDHNAHSGVEVIIRPEDSILVRPGRCSTYNPVLCLVFPP